MRVQREESFNRVSQSNDVELAINCPRPSAIKDSATCLMNLSSRQEKQETRNKELVMVMVNE